MLSKTSFWYQLFVFRRIFLKTLCCLVGLPRELYPQVHKEIINLTAWFAVLYQRNYFIFLQRVCSKVILPGCPDGCRHLIYVIATAIGWTIPRGPMEVADVYHVVWSLPFCFRRTRLCVIDWTIPRGSTQIECCPEAWNLLCRLFDDRKYMDIYLPIPQEFCYLGKQKKFVFSRFSLGTLVTFTFAPSKLRKMWADSQ